jgi:glycosyltransferase involved in cell wall biosynthesis
MEATGPARWLGYIDKFAIFPTTLDRHLDWADVVHICDHANAMYLHWTAIRPTLVTCHDLLAVRAARGEATDCTPSRTGRYLQRWVLASLRRAHMIAAVSRATLADTVRLVGLPGRLLRLVPNGLNHPYGRRDAETCRERMGVLPWPQQRPFILHVGSNETRKNRAGVLRVFARLKDRWPGDLVFVGRPLTAELQQQASALGLEGRVHQLSGIDNPRLEALYNLEAQVCGCPVVCSDCSVFLEIAGPGACIRQLGDEAGMAEDLLRLADPVARHAHIASGLENARGYSAESMIDSYARLYRELAVARQ